MGYVAPPNEADVADDPDLALPGIRVGRAGLEKQHDRDLRGSAGAVQLEVNALGRVIRELDRQEGVPGEEVGLTIDVALQQTVLGRLGDESASAVVLDCRNGEVLAMATNPSFDPALFNAGVSQAQWTEWAQDKRTPLLNRATAGVYAPGSTFKMAVAMAGAGVGHRLAWRCRPLPRVFRSRQCAVPLLAQGRPRHARSAWRIEEQLRRVTSMRPRGASASTASRRWRIASAWAPNWRSTCRARAPASSRRANGASARAIAWNTGDTVVSGIGQGYIQVTPLQLATYAARVATGREVQPHLTRKLGGVLQPGSQSADWPSLGLSDRSLHVVREGMWAVVNEPGGTAPVGEAA